MADFQAVIVLTIKTDKEEAEVALFDVQKKLNSVSWHAHRTLAVTLNQQIKKLINKSSISNEQLEGIVVFSGPGSFTGLRIGAAVANALAYSLDIPVVAAAGENWQKDGIEAIEYRQNDKIAIPEYGASPNTTSPKR